MMNQALGDEVSKCCLVYVGLRLKWEKCKVEQRVEEFVDYVITKGRIKPSQGKVQKILNFPAQSNVKQLRGFLGLTGYFRKFIKGFSSIVIYEPTSIKDKNEQPIENEGAKT